MKSTICPQKDKSFIAESGHFLFMSKTLLPKTKNIEMHILVDQNI